MENSDTEMIDKVREVAIWWRKTFGRSLGITGELGELYARKFLGLEPARVGEKEYDATKAGKRYQIKTRAPARGVEVDPRGRIGKFRGLQFDYALLVLLDNEYKLKEIYQADVRTIENLAKKEETERAGMHVSSFIKRAKRIYGEASPRELQ